jgi:predicted MFS family arabinose efflux permease
MPRYLDQHHGVSYEASEDFWKQPLFYGGISCLVGGFVSDRLVKKTGSRRWGRAICPLVGLTTAAAAIGAIPAIRDPQTAITLICLAGAAYDFGQAAAWASIVDVGGRHPGVAAGFVNMVGNSGNAIQPYIGSLVFTHLGWGPLFGLYAGAFLLAASLWLWIDPRHSFDQGR